MISNFHPSWSGHAAEGLQRAGYRVLSLGSIRHAQPGDEYRCSRPAWALRHLSRLSPVWKDELFLSAMGRMEPFAEGECLKGRLFWGWSGFSLGPLMRCRDAGIPRVLDTGSSHMKWSENKLKAEIERQGARGFSRRREALHEGTFREYEVADVICVPSGFVRDTFVECGVAKEKIYVNPYGVDGEAWRAVAEARRNKSPAGPFVFIFAGAVMLRKGIAYLLDAWRALGEQDAELWLAGGLHRDCREKVRSLPKGVKFLGHQSWDKLAELYERADVYVLPSLEEGMARSVIEAMAAGLPVIVTRETGTTEVMVDGEDGWIVEAANIEALKEALRGAIEGRGRLREMGASARARVDGYTWEAYGARAADLVKRLIG